MPKIVLIKLFSFLSISQENKKDRGPWGLILCCNPFPLWCESDRDLPLFQMKSDDEIIGGSSHTSVPVKQAALYKTELSSLLCPILILPLQW